MDKTTANEVVTGAPGTIALGGRTFLVAQPGVPDFMVLRKYLREAFRKNAQSSLASIAKDLEALKPADRAEAIKAAVNLQHTREVELGAGKMMEMLEEPIHCAFWLGHLVRKADPSVDVQADLNPHVKHETVIEILADLFRASSMDAVEKNSPGRTG